METVKIDDKVIPLDSLSDELKTKLQLLKFVDEKLIEKRNTIALFKRARNSYIKALGREIISAKSGIDLLSEE